MGTVAGHALSTFTTPVNATSPIDANEVRGNDNSIGTNFNAHDADATIHLQNGAVASRPAAATAGAGATWLATDTDAVYVWYTDGSSWIEIDYLRNTGGTVSGAVTITSASATALAVGPNGTTNPVFEVDASTASAAAGLKVTGAVAAGTVAVAVISSGAAANLSLDAKGTGTITLGGTSTGAITLTRATTLSAALTYGGVTLTNAVTGTGKMVLDAAPTFTNGITVSAGTSALQAVTGTTGTFTGLFDLSAATAGQVKFPASQNASADVNTLDDYEEGSWTPAVGGTATYTTQSGNYVKVGKLVYAQFSLAINLIGTGSATTVSGLPFTVGSAGSVVVGYFGSLATNVGQMGGIAGASGTSFTFYSTAGAGTVMTAQSVLGNSADVRGYVVYSASA